MISGISLARGEVSHTAFGTPGAFHSGGALKLLRLRVIVNTGLEIPVLESCIRSSMRFISLSGRPKYSFLGGFRIRIEAIWARVLPYQPQKSSHANFQIQTGLVIRRLRSDALTSRSKKMTGKPNPIAILVDGATSL